MENSAEVWEAGKLVDPTALARSWVNQERQKARERGEALPPPWSRVSTWDRRTLGTEAHAWADIANGVMVQRVVPRTPTPEAIRSVRRSLTESLDRLHAMKEARLPLLPEDVSRQVEAIERRIAMALDAVEAAPSETAEHPWEAAAAWAELHAWLFELRFTKTPYPPTAQ